MCIRDSSYIEQELCRQGVGFRKLDNAFVSVEDAGILQAAADRLSGEVIQKRLNYWTVLLGPKFSKHDRRAAMLERSYYVHQVEYLSLIHISEPTRLGMISY